MVDYLDFITPDWVFDLGTRAVEEWQSDYKLLVMMGKEKEAHGMLQKSCKQKGRQ